MLHGIDISNWQRDIDVTALSGIQVCVVKATEGTGYVSPACDSQYQAAKAKGLLRGFYHFAGNGSATAEADYFIANCEGYFGDGVPILDWEGGNGFDQSVNWVNEFVRRVHDVKGVWPVIYANPWRFNQGGVDQNCGRWVASYPAYTSPTFAQAEGWDCPEADGLVCGWQFCSDGKVSGFSGQLDLTVWYMDAEAWAKYAGASSGPAEDPEPEGAEAVVLENDELKVTVERK